MALNASKPMGIRRIQVSRASELPSDCAATPGKARGYFVIKIFYTQVSFFDHPIILLPCHFLTKQVNAKPIFATKSQEKP